MSNPIIILAAAAAGLYLLVFVTHALRHRAGLGPFYALLGALTAIMAWVTDAGLVVQVGDITFVVGSTVFYTSLLVGVFVVYVFDGPRAARIAILTVAGASVLTPVVAAVLHAYLASAVGEALAGVPVPGLRVNVASVLTTLVDMVFLAVAWEFLGAGKLKLHVSVRTYLTLLGVMWLDVVLFATGAYAGTPGYLNILGGTLITRLVCASFVWPFLYIYLNWENRRSESGIKKRPVLAIVRMVEDVQEELSRAQKEIERRKKAEAEKEQVIKRLQRTLKRVQRLEGLLPMCSGCNRIRVEKEDAEEWDKWISLEEYVRDETTVEVSHGLCHNCIRGMYPEMADRILERMGDDSDDMSGNG
ncbi:MAG: hypothetical protein ACOC0A_02340 [Planctomycetota bacterium]